MGPELCCYAPGISCKERSHENDSKTTKMTRTPLE
jgi:hypothetical protein